MKSIKVTCSQCGQVKNQTTRFRRINARTNEYSTVCMTCERGAKGSDRLEKVRTRQVEKPTTLIGPVVAKLILLVEDDPKTARQLADETGGYCKTISNALREMTNKGYLEKDDTIHFMPTYLATSNGASIARESILYYGGEVKKTYQSTNPWDWRTFRAPGASQRPLGF